MLEEIESRGKPVITVPAAPVETMEIVDDIEGTGHEVPVGGHVTVHYVGVGQASAKQFDASWDRNEAFSFPLGRGYVIKGWDQGVAGMQVGGRRRVTIPPHLGYGAQGAGGAIKGGETLVLVVDLLDVR